MRMSKKINSFFCRFCRFRHFDGSTTSCFGFAQQPPTASSMHRIASLSSLRGTKQSIENQRVCLDCFVPSLSLWTGSRSSPPTDDKSRTRHCGLDPQSPRKIGQIIKEIAGQAVRLRSLTARNDGALENCH
jgi:hypothetical protein